jgi:hypothetical protein
MCPVVGAYKAFVLKPFQYDKQLRSLVWLYYLHVPYFETIEAPAAITTAHLSIYAN